MEVENVLHMNGGNGDESYANNSFLQKKVLLLTKPVTEQAIIDLYCSLHPKSLSIADLGCSSGPNTLLVVSQLIKTIHKTCKKKGNESPEFQIYLNDLPGNDFNAIFQSLATFHENLRKEMGSDFGPCLFNGVPGSFYQRLFSTNSLHFIHSSYSLHWLSKVPKGVLEKNKGNIYISTTSPPSVVKAYYEQFEKDFLMFLKFRSMELVTGGRMVLTILGRKSEDPCSKEGCYIWELLAKVLNEMVSEGIIQEEDLDSFNIPKYTPSPREVKFLIEKEGSFTINDLEASEMHWTGCDSDVYLSGELKDGGYNVAKCMRAMAEPLLVSHFGEEIIDEVFCRYRQILSDSMSKEKTEFINVTVSTTKRKMTIDHDWLASF